MTAPASVIGIGGDHSHLPHGKDHYDHVMSPFHRKIYFRMNSVHFYRHLNLIEDDNEHELPLLDDKQATINEQNQGNHENPMDMDTSLTHIPGADDTTLLSNVSDEFVLPPIANAGKI